MRVVLLYPEVYDMARFREGRKEFPPFGVLYLASAVRDGGHEVAVRKVTKVDPPLDLTSYDAVGVSLASSATYGILLEAIRRAALSPRVLLMAGGVHANFYPEQTLTDFDADVVSYGESEETILQLLDHAGDRDFSGVPGVVARRADGSVFRTTPVVPRRDISHLPLPARELLPDKDFVMSDRLAGRDIRMAHVMLSRGCPFPCSFCAAGRTRIQYRDGHSARKELQHLISAYDIGGFAIVDDNFVVAKERVRDICTHIADLGLRWSALSRVDTVDADLLTAMARAGCIEIKFGVESGSETMLRAMRKNTTRAKITRAIDSAVQAGIEAKAFIIHGYPGENQRTTDETIGLLDTLSDRLSRVSLFRFVPLPGTEVYEQRIDGHQVIHGTHLASGWDHDWEKFHIHHNDRHWWGSEQEFVEVQSAFSDLERFVEERWGAQK
ncbi:B12-binding domain-containing radical SAM protein [Nocardia sp. NPDC057227]|uniref:B12-binding domain-containing radical SAM protein n=1 Tax=Nocardia sp. NPDC057227 TaxID=3346056 RepID=UPI0036455C55